MQSAASTRTSQLPTSSRRICKAIISPSTSAFTGARAHKRRFGMLNFPSPFITTAEDLFPTFRLFDPHHHQPSFRITRRWAQPPPALQFFKVLDRSAVAPPRFDIREGTAAYELQGEVPGLGHDDVVIEFVNPRTLVVKGRRGEREETGTNSKGKNPEGKNLEGEGKGKNPEGVTPKSQQATVEDVEDAEEVQAITATAADAAAAADEDVNSSTTTTATVGGGANTPTSSSASSSVESTTNQPPASAQPEPNNPNPTDTLSSETEYKYWLNERVLTQKFERRFKFPADVDVDHEAVKASLRNGILRIVVPKVVRKEEEGGKEGGRRILVE